MFFGRSGRNCVISLERAPDFFRFLFVLQLENFELIDENLIEADKLILRKQMKLATQKENKHPSYKSLQKQIQSFVKRPVKLINSN